MLVVIIAYLRWFDAWHKLAINKIFLLKMDINNKLNRFSTPIVVLFLPNCTAAFD